MIGSTGSAARWAALAWGLAMATVCAQPAPGVAETPGYLLYTTHCAGCHTAQVRLWQRNLGLGWSDEDIAAVAGYLNAVYYKFPLAGARA